MAITVHTDKQGAEATRAAVEERGQRCLVAQHGILVSSVAPGEMATPMTGQRESEAPHLDRPGNPIGRPGHVTEVAQAVLFLASPRSSYVTGVSLVVDGGLLLMAAHGRDTATGWRDA